MRRLLVSTFALATVAGVAFAQQEQPAASEPPVASKAQDQMLPPPGPPGRDASETPDAMWPHDHAGPPHGNGDRRWGPPPPPPFRMPSKAAHFMIEDGPRRIDVKCADDEPTKVCADTVLQIIDKLGPAPRHLMGEQDR